MPSNGHEGTVIFSNVLKHILLRLEIGNLVLSHPLMWFLIEIYVIFCKISNSKPAALLVLYDSEKSADDLIETKAKKEHQNL